ncbi:uncharacterized protein LOC126953397 [Macaca thibetana thibetana]|uniref:uncharacterized protein LOC126953397 n=1 Tax=Macaca thibetana thibetana TaxID=257877 RepID=UPI0021BC6B36|nr:uncharacterized protein LOC126953397 [Macaca thibetana thibetana]
MSSRSTVPINPSLARAGVQLAECPRGPPPRARGCVRPSTPAAPPLCAAITGSRRAFSQARAPRPFCLRLGSRPSSTGVQLHPVAVPRPPRSSEKLWDQIVTTRARLSRLPHARPDLEANPPPPRPPRIRLRSDTRNPRPTPGHVSRSQYSHSPPAEQRGPGTPRSLPCPDGSHQTKGPRAEAAVTKRLLCHPPDPLRKPKLPPAAAQAGPRRPRRPGLGRDSKACASGGQPPPCSPEGPGVCLRTAGRNRPATGP